jgi:hypothetical protein
MRQLDLAVARPRARGMLRRPRWHGGSGLWRAPSTQALASARAAAQTERAQIGRARGRRRAHGQCSASGSRRAPSLMRRLMLWAKWIRSLVIGRLSWEVRPGNHAPCSPPAPKGGIGRRHHCVIAGDRTAARAGTTQHTLGAVASLASSMVVQLPACGNLQRVGDHEVFARQCGSESPLTRGA